MRKIIHVDMDCFFRSGGDARQSRPARYPLLLLAAAANDGG